MATPPLVCSSPANSTFRGIGMDRCELKLYDGTIVKSTFSLCDFSSQIDDFSYSTTCLEPGRSFIINSDNIGSNGEVKMIIIKVSYPSSLVYQDKYINFINQGKTLPIGDIMMLSGNPNSNSPGRGWDLNANGTDITSPYFTDGGIILFNPHSVKINVQIIIGFTATIETSDIFITTEDNDYLMDDDGNYLTL